MFFNHILAQPLDFSSIIFFNLIYNYMVSHLKEVEEGLDRLHYLGGHLICDKCHIKEENATLLGHAVSRLGIKVDFAIIMSKS